MNKILSLKIVTIVLLVLLRASAWVNEKSRFDFYCFTLKACYTIYPIRLALFSWWYNADILMTAERSFANLTLWSLDNRYYCYCIFLRTKQYNQYVGNIKQENNEHAL
jgi:hypothetical protein